MHLFHRRPAVSLTFLAETATSRDVERWDCESTNSVSSHSCYAQGRKERRKTHGQRACVMPGRLPHTTSAANPKLMDIKIRTRVYDR
ncbi:hypothetical protein BU25DRAFT_408741 [Macroventuria anomochaeta]|uniref:Uncharacterized protein n=1 Tax=Macroventuria anomochaeta TaxID=301207 RepID=A0ACB6S7X9_9PLEO|nr:uncharacterized protein BU25DRAFT_408741 [Macroventuria anomochaeta]KAF2630153.1 hypothetical protein BU25DRAFT_408741 [Macroventuria anomochaeta]